MGVKVTFLENEPKAGAKQEKSAAVALVPAKAIRQDNTSKYVFVLKGDTIERRAVQTGEERSGQVEILAGITPDVTVVTNGPDTLHDGQSVQVQK
jgi:hypothetical protein